MSAEAPLEPRLATSSPPQEPGEEEKVLYDAASESVSIGEEDRPLNTMRSLSDTDGITDNTVLLAKKKEESGCLPCCKFCPSYHSRNPGSSTITPFSLVLLAVLFAIYILNQADRLVLPVAIPSGLRCEASVKNECRNLTHVDLADISDLADVSDMADVSVEPEDMALAGYVAESENRNLSNVKNETEDCIHFSDNEQGLLTGNVLYFSVIITGV